MFVDDARARAILNWLHAEELLKVSHGEGDSLDAAIWKGATLRWPDKRVRRSYGFFDPVELGKPDHSPKRPNRETGHTALSATIRSEFRS